MNNPLVSIIVPARNEEVNIPLLVQNLQELIRKKKLLAQIVLVDDNSTDATPKVCDELEKKYRNIIAIHRAGNPGMGAALKEGTKKASGDIIVWVMADLADDLGTIPGFVEKIGEGADLVFGSRYIAGGSSGDLDLWKKIFSSGFSKISGWLLCIPAHDITNAFRAFKKGAFLGLELDSDDFGISPEFALKAYLAGYKVAEVPTTYVNRKRGIAKFKMGKMGLRYSMILLKALFNRPVVKMTPSTP